MMQLTGTWTDAERICVALALLGRLHDSLRDTGWFRLLNLGQCSRDITRIAKVLAAPVSELQPQLAELQALLDSETSTIG